MARESKMPPLICLGLNELSQYGAFALEKQFFFEKMTKGNAPKLDLKNAEVRFGDKLVFPVQILGTLFDPPSMDDDPWWEWSCDSEYLGNTKTPIPPELTSLSRKMSEYGYNNDLDFLTECTEGADVEEMNVLCLTALGLFGAGGYFVKKYGHGFYKVCFTVTSKETEKKVLTSSTPVLDIFPDFVSTYSVPHRSSFINYLNHKKFKVECVDAKIIGTKGKMKVTAVFSETRYNLIDIYEG
jgi:hypothetical protein